MEKYIKIFFGTLVISFVIFFLGNGFFDGGNLLETTILSVGAVIILLLSYLIAQIHYLIDLVGEITKKN
ncbi:hypothetical protein D7Z54_20225 [Salibacterium salarium]|uniref:Uncharacterized protein n=1 Tax=Salibacterium salarium TaxID=284579 RepID=A0A428MZP2_9BACI|nr:hypothetical protein [Salibacterium salarium]RSL31566.1 hypothetical protein D7Z54_20225 [Salibacterium salarium]